MKGYSVTYSTDHKVPAGNGDFVSTQTQGESLAPHLEKHCPHCNFGWLEEVACGGMSVSGGEATRPDGRSQ